LNIIIFDIFTVCTRVLQHGTVQGVSSEDKQRAWWIHTGSSWRPCEVSL